MMMLSAIAMLWASGIGPALAVDRRQPPLALAGLAFLYGSGLLYVILLLQSLAGVRWTLAMTVAVLTIVSGACLLWSLRSPVIAAQPALRLSWIDGGTALLVAAYARCAIATRPPHGDFWMIWGLKGRVFFEAGGIDWPWLENVWNRYAHPDYPLLLPFNYAFVAMVMGEWSDRWIGAVSVAFGVALLLIVRSAAASESGRHTAAMTTLAVTTFALAPQIALAEAPVIAFGTAGLLMLRRAILCGDDAVMRHAAILLGLAAVTKNEGLSLLAAVVVGMMLARAPGRYFVALWPAAALAGTWLVLRAMHDLPTDIATAGAFERVAARVSSATAQARLMITWITTPLLLLALLAGAAVARPGKLVRETVILAAVVVQFAFFTAVYLATPYDPAWHIMFSWDRISRQIVAPLVFSVMVALAQTFAPDQDDGYAEARSLV